MPASFRWLGLACFALTACVDTTESDEPAADTGILDEPEPIDIIETDPIPPSLDQDPASGPYRYQNVAIQGGGFVTGIVFSRAAPNLVYARTDVGGAYRFGVSQQRWIPMTDWLGQANNNLMGIESIAADPVDPARVYLAGGTYLGAGPGSILSSTDYGVSFETHSIGAPMGGNHNGRSMGERLMVDPNFPRKLYFASRTSGLLKSEDFSETWSRVDTFPEVGDEELGLSLVLFDPESGEEGAPTPRLYVGVASLSRPTLYRSDDAGESFRPVAGAPTGMMPHHAVLGPSGLLYLAYNDGPGPNDITRGAIWELDPETGEFRDISPETPAGGFGGLSVDTQREGVLMASTIDLWSPDLLFRSTNGGNDWREIGGSARRDDNGATWLRFDGAAPSATGWMGDLEIDPFNRSRALYVTGQGIWWSDDVTVSDALEPASFVFRNDGLEETVPLDLACPPEGALLLSALGDIAGFRHDDLSLSPPDGMFKNPLFGNTSSIDFAELAPDRVVRAGTASGARGAHSEDGGRTWSRFPSEPPESQGEGSIAINADGTSIVWSARAAPSFSLDRGETWTRSEGLTESVRVASDRVNPDLFYAVGRTAVYVSRDRGQSFLPTLTEALARGARLRPVFGLEGDLWLVRPDGLFHSKDAGESFEPLPGVASALAVGFGMAAPDEDYPALYLSGVVDGEEGLYRSDDGGETFVSIHDERHRFGWVSHITGDPRQYGRVYLGTGGRGIVYGDPR